MSTDAALKACLQYDHWKREIDRLSTEITLTTCPQEDDPSTSPLEHDHRGLSHFAVASKKMVPNTPGLPEDGPRPMRLDEVERAVSDCPSCSRLCDLIRARRHARKRWGVAKRQIRHVARKATP